MAQSKFKVFSNHSNFFYVLLAIHALVILAGLGSAYYMEHNGHYVTGMDNQIVWGMPHVFAVFLVVAASGALNVASISSVFHKMAYKPFARLSGLLALALLAGGLSVLVLDLGRPDRLIVAMTTYNFKSIFAWNIYLYIGFFVVVGVYLWFMMEERMNRYTSAIGMFAFVWRLVLTTGTGSIFGFLAARELYDAAIMAPLFIASSFIYGMAFTVLVLSTICRTIRSRLMSDEVITKFRGLIVVFIMAVLYLTAVHFLTKLYASKNQDVVRYILIDGGAITAIFWIGQILLGSLLPIALVTHSKIGASRLGIETASFFALVGGVAQIYVFIVGGQSFPLDIFPGMEAASGWIDGKTAHYIPSLPEIVLGISGISITMLIVGVVIKVLPFMPSTIEEEPEPEESAVEAEAPASA